MPRYSWTLMCSSYQDPSRSPAARPEPARIEATNDPYMVSLSSSAGTGLTDASSSRAAVDLPAPGAPATTQAAGTSFMARKATRGSRQAARQVRLERLASFRRSLAAAGRAGLPRDENDRSHGVVGDWLYLWLLDDEGPGYEHH